MSVPGTLIASKDFTINISLSMLSRILFNKVISLHINLKESWDGIQTNTVKTKGRSKGVLVQISGDHSKKERWKV